MKRAVSLVIAAALISLSIVPTFAQKRQVTTVSKKSKAEVESTRFAGFAAHTDGTGVWLSWQMRAEIGNIGFRVYRVGKEGAELLSPEKFVGGSAIHGREIPSYGATYGYYDAAGDGNSAYYVEAFTLSGEKIPTQTIYPQYVIDLESFTGLETSELAMRGESEPALLESSVLTYTKEIANEMSENQIAPDPVTHKTIIATPGAARIGVKTEGIVRVTKAQLEAAGFAVNGDSSLWQLYLEGNEQAIIIGPNADYIEFYGKGMDTNETDIRRYFLITGTTPGKRMESRVATRGTSTVVTPSYLQTFVKKERIQWVDDIINDDIDNYFGRGIGSSVNTMTFNLSGVDFTVPNVTLRLQFQGYSQTRHKMEVTLNDNILPPTSAQPPWDAGEVVFHGLYSIPTSHLVEGVNTIKFRSAETPADFSFFDTMTIDFSRTYLADQNKLSFYTQNYRTAKLSGFTSSDVRVFDITREGSPVLMTNLQFQANGPTFGVDMPASRGRSFYAVGNSAILAPESVTSNNPELIGIPTNGADLIIIAYKNFMAEAQTWANYRMNQGAAVKVIEVSEVYDEYNYGSLSSDSIKSFLQYAHTNWANKPEYVLLIGDGSWDSRNYENLGFFNYVPPRIVSTVYTDTASDEYLADFNNDGLAEIPIGRISARTPAQVTTAYNKMVAWEAQFTTGNPLTRGALFAYDSAVDYPFEQMSINLRDKIPMITPATMIKRGSGNSLVAAMNTGKFIVNYSGHGSPGSWNGDFFTVNNVSNTPTFPDPSNPMVDHDPAFYTMLTCLNGFFHWLYFPSMAETLNNAPNRGAVASWASSGKTTPDMQELMAVRFYTKLGEGNIPKLGDLVKDSKSALINVGADVRLSWVLLGDPMMKLRNPPPPPPAK